MEGDRRPTEIVRYSPYRAPKEKFGDGRWTVYERHFDKGYPLRWLWTPKGSSENPPEEPPNNNLLTRKELDGQISENMGKYWDKYTSKDGRPPIGGAQND